MKHLWFIRNPHASLSPNEGVQWLCREVDQTLTGTRTGNNSIGMTAGLIEAVLICGGFFQFGRWLVGCLRHNRYNPAFFASPYPFNRPIRPNKKIRKIAQVQNAAGAAVSRCDDMRCNELRCEELRCEELHRLKKELPLEGARCSERQSARQRVRLMPF